MFFVRKKRCKYCASILENNECKNPNCIAYVDENNTNATKDNNIEKTNNKE